jgi:glycosyltransferase involved in cell wall biosynthesis
VKQSIVVLYHPSLWPLAERLDPRVLVYYPFDNFAKAGGWSNELAAAERAAVERAALVVASSKSIADDLPGQPRAKARVLGNGVDFKAVLDAAGLPCPPEIAAIPRPRFGYCGVVNRKVDFDLVEQIALRRPEWHWVFVGPERGLLGDVDRESRRYGEALVRCRRLRNVHFLGAMPHPEIFACLHHMDVNVICNRADSGWWQDSYPLKFHEYLAAGKPVVSSRIGSLLEFAKVADLVEGLDGWIPALERALSGGGAGTMSERRAVARENDWDTRVLVLERWLTELAGSEAPSEKMAA